MLQSSPARWKERNCCKASMNEMWFLQSLSRDAAKLKSRIILDTGHLVVSTMRLKVVENILSKFEEE